MKIRFFMVSNFFFSCPVITEADQTMAPSVWIVGEGIFEVIRPAGQDETIGSILKRVGGIPAGQSEIVTHQAGRELPHLKIQWHHKDREVSFYFGRDDARMWSTKIFVDDRIFVSRDPFVWVGKLDRKIVPRKPKAGQAGTGNPATRPESDSEGGDKSQPEAKGRSR
jgi:hypothetical protein